MLNKRKVYLDLNRFFVSGETEKIEGKRRTEDEVQVYDFRKY